MTEHGVRVGHFHITVGDDQEHEDLTAELTYEGRFIALVSQEDGFENLQIELFGSHESLILRCRFDEFSEALLCAKRRLWELRRDEEGDPSSK